jgi:hypothetical protein
VETALYLVSISAKAMAKIEFLQQEWINNGNFMNLAEERDPNVDLQEGGATSRSPECRSGAASTASRRSTCCGVASTSSCRRYRRWDGSERSADRCHPISCATPEIETIDPNIDEYKTQFVNRSGYKTRTCEL